jgi:hypothetical protein
MNRKLLVCLAILAAAALPAFAGEWHSGNNNVCTDCHTMHFSQQHNWDSNAVPANTPAANGNWLGGTGPNAFLLKLPVNQLCASCHDGQSFAPDVIMANFNPAPALQGRSAGALNEQTGSVAPYDTWKGHSLGSTSVPPGWNTAAVNVPGNYYDNTGGLECTCCHAQHGPPTAYRNLGSYSAGGAATPIRPTYAITTTFTGATPCNNGANAPCDVWVNIASPYTPNSGSAATFNPYYDSGNVIFYRTNPASPTGATTVSSNRMDTFCGSCHGDFHGQTGDANIGGGVLPGPAADGFLRHPTSGQVIGSASAGGHSSLTRYVAQPGFRAKVYTTDFAAFSDATPGCVSCHKGHGNANPFGLIFTSHSGNPGFSATYPEEGNWDITQPYQQGYRNLCGQCHGQGN